MLGRQGNVRARQRRAASRDRAPRRARRERWRFVNAANGRYFNLELPGHTFLVIGWDGGPRPDAVRDATAARRAGRALRGARRARRRSRDTLALRTVHYDRGHNIPDPGPDRPADDGASARARRDTRRCRRRGATSSRLAFDAATPRRRFVLREDDTRPDGSRSSRSTTRRSRTSRRCRRRWATRDLGDREHRRDGPSVPPARHVVPGRSTCGHSVPSRSAGRTPSTSRRRRRVRFAVRYRCARAAGCTTATSSSTPSAG